MPDDFQHLQVIDEATRDIHPYLTAADEVLFWREYTSNAGGYAFGATNQFITNLKKKPNSSNEYELGYKARTIRACSAYFTRAINPDWLRGAILVPVPCSKMAGHAEYDDRMTQVCRGITLDNGHADVRELVYQTGSLAASHTLGPGERPTVQDLVNVYAINEALVPAQAPTKIGIVDDVLTNGTHFKAVSQVLKARWPDVRIVGFFVARRIFPQVQPADFDF